MQEKLIQVTEVGSTTISPPIRLSQDALSLAQEFYRITEHKKDLVVRKNFSQDILTLMASYISPEVLHFAIYMELKLAENLEKKGDSWKNLSQDELSTRMCQELKELQEKISRGAPAEAVWREAADVGNFLMFAATNYSHRDEQE